MRKTYISSLEQTKNKNCQTQVNDFAKEEKNSKLILTKTGKEMEKADPKSVKGHQQEITFLSLRESTFLLSNFFLTSVIYPQEVKHNQVVKNS